MKLTKNVWLGAWLAVGVLSAPLAHAQSAKVATFKRVEGDVMVQQGAGPSRRVESGASLMPSDKIVTGPSSSAAVTLRDGTVLVVGAGTAMQLSDFSFNGTTQQGGFTVNLLSGVMRMVTGLLGQTSAENLKVVTPTMTVGVRGTDFIVEAP